MVKNIFGKALLSLIMNKKARSNLGKIREAKSKSSILQKDILPRNENHPPKSAAKPRKPLAREAQDPQALWQKLDKGAAKLSEIDQLQEALQRLEKALNNGILDQPVSNPPSARAAGLVDSGQKKIVSERQTLISQALATQRSKAKLLDALSSEDRLKLHLMAKKIMKQDKN